MKKIEVNLREYVIMHDKENHPYAVQYDEHFDATAQLSQYLKSHPADRPEEIHSILNAIKLKEDVDGNFILSEDFFQLKYWIDLNNSMVSHI